MKAWTKERSKLKYYKAK